MKIFLFSLLLFLAACSPTKKTAITAPVSYTFPDDWLGSYEGEMEMWNAKHGKFQSCPMQVKITATDTIGRYRWYSQIKFNDNIIAKDYNLMRHDTMPPNHYLMDENNGIYLDRILLDNSFYDYFEVNGIGLYGITRRVPEGISFEIASFKQSSVTYSRYKGNNSKVDSVASYKVLNTQKVLLRPTK